LEQESAVRSAMANLTALKLLGSGFPYGTIFVNIVGSFIMGLAIEWLALKFDPGQMWRLFLTTGILGGFTTFSAFSLDAALLIARGAYVIASAYILISLIASLGGLFLGLLLIRQWA
jgi:CrcB protein